jgi:hypothetical protein
LAASEDRRAICHVLEALAQHDPNIVAAGERALVALEGRVAPADLALLEETVRSSTLQSMSWHGMDLDRVSHRKWKPASLAMFTMHASGHVRQFAVERLDASDGGRALPYLLQRLNDWVPQVRAAAARAVQRRLTPERVGEWEGSLGLVEALRGRGRADHAWVGMELSRLLRHPLGRPLLEACFWSEDRRVARAAFRIALDLGAAGRDWFIAEAASHRDPILRLEAAKQVRTLKDAAGRDALLERMARDPFMPIRREELYDALERPPREARGRLMEALLDRHPSMREAARFYIKRLAGPAFDIRAFYAERLREEGDRATAVLVAGLGETGRATDTPLVEQYVASRRQSVARAAVRAIASLDGDRRSGLFHECLADSRLGVSAEGARALMNRQGVIDWAQVRTVLRAGNAPHNRWHALSLVLRRHPYDAVPDAIEAACSDDQAVAAAARDYLNWFGWQGRLSHGPTLAQAQAVSATLHVHGEKLPANLQERVRRFAL